MKRRIISFVLAGVILAVAAFCCWQWDNLKAAFTAITTDSQTLEQSKGENRDNLQQKLEQEYSISVQMPSIEQTEAILNGDLTAEDVMPPPAQPQTPTPPAASQQTPQQPEQTQPDVQSIEEQKTKYVNSCIEKLYACEMELMQQLSTMKQDVVDTWNALPKGQKTKAKKTEMIFGGLKKCYTLEADVDQRVKGILAECKTNLEAIGADSSVTETLWQYYCEEKATQKAYYLDKYLNE